MRIVLFVVVTQVLASCGVAGSVEDPENVDPNSLASSSSLPRTIHALSPRYNDIMNAVSQANDGDTVVVPRGTASWTQRLEITKSITLQGQTMTFNAGTANATATDLTIIKDELPRPLPTVETGLFLADMGATNRFFRITGFTFTHGTSTQYTAGDGNIMLKGGSLATPNYSMRIDHCHFDHMYAKDVRNLGVNYGLADHNIHDADVSEESYYITTAGGDLDRGNTVWADYPYFGTAKFFFIEDNTFRGPNADCSACGTIDSQVGGRWVARHNYFLYAHLGGHGTEGGPTRGMRATERYSNTLESSISNSRSGNHLIHDNVYLGMEPENAHRLTYFRGFGAVGINGGTWGTSDGTSPWDKNDTEGNDTYVEGHPPHLFDSGSAHPGNGLPTPEGTMIDTNKHWTPDQWVGYSIRHLGVQKGSFITGNTANTITYVRYGSTDRGPLIIFNSGDQYQIHRVIQAMDQAGLGKGDLIAGNPPINQQTGTSMFPHQQSEPSISWNNVHQPTGHVLGIGSNMANERLNRDYYNLGNGFTGSPQFLRNTYTAARNGVQYSGTYQYPHPLQNR